MSNLLPFELSISSNASDNVNDNDHYGQNQENHIAT